MEDKQYIKQKYLFIILCFVYGISIAGTQYVSTYLKTIGLSAAQVGIFTSLRSIIGIVAPIIWGAICDKFQTVKKPFVVCSIGMIILFPFIPFSETALHLFALTPWLTIISRFFYRPVEYILSAWLAQLNAKDNRFDYGKIRIFSTIGTLVGSSIFTYLFAIFSIRISFYWVGIFGLLMLLVVPFVQDVAPIKNNSEPLKLKDFLKIFNQPKLLALYILAVALNLPLTVRVNYVAYLLDDLGCASNYVSLILTMTTITALPFIFYSNRIIRKLKAVNVLIYAGLACCLIQIGLTLSHNIYLVLLFSAIEGMANGIRNTALVLYSYENAPKELKNTVVMINSSITAVATIITSLLAGTTIDKYGVRYFYSLAAIVITAITFGYIIFKKLYLDKKQNAD